MRNFRSIATKYGVTEQWIGRIETTIIDHLKSWGEWEEVGKNKEEYAMIAETGIANITIDQLKRLAAKYFKKSQDLQPSRCWS